MASRTAARLATCRADRAATALGGARFAATTLATQGSCWAAGCNRTSATTHAARGTAAPFRGARRAKHRLAGTTLGTARFWTCLTLRSIAAERAPRTACLRSWTALLSRATTAIFTAFFTTLTRIGRGRHAAVRSFLGATPSQCVWTANVILRVLAARGVWRRSWAATGRTHRRVARRTARRVTVVATFALLLVLTAALLTAMLY